MRATLLLLSCLLLAPAIASATVPTTPATTPGGIVKPATPPYTEQQKIEYLLAAVAHLQGAVFIRNGSEYTAAQAVDHMRYKWKAAGSRIKTAEDFIVNCASKSSMSGLPYRIRFANGKTEDSAEFFHAELTKLDKLATR